MVLKVYSDESGTHEGADMVEEKTKWHRMMRIGGTVLVRVSKLAARRRHNPQAGRLRYTPSLPDRQCVDKTSCKYNAENLF